MQRDCEDKGTSGLHQCYVTAMLTDFRPSIALESSNGICAERAGRRILPYLTRRARHCSGGEGYFDFDDLELRFKSHFAASKERSFDGLEDVTEGLSFGTPLRNASRQRRAFGNNKTILSRNQRHQKFLATSHHRHFST